MAWWLLTWLFLISKVVAFFPNRIAEFEIGHDTYTHEDITRIGVLRAVASFFEGHPRNGSSVKAGDLTGLTDITARNLFEKYYGDGSSEKRLTEAIDAIITSNNHVDGEHYNRAVWHCNGETIHDAHIKMGDLKEKIFGILQENANMDAARESIGQYLHILQMFYSNTNWVEMKGDIPYYSLGTAGESLYGQALSSTDTCKSCEGSTGNDCDKTLLVKDNILTSGYRSGQDIVKPARDPSKYQTGKCSHGGIMDSSGTDFAALGGINKDSTLSTYSPHYKLHKAAAEAAIKHTTYFFEDKEKGLRSQISDIKYQRLLQLKSGRSLAFVIDKTGSMRDDIEAVKKVVINITSVSSGFVNEPSNYIIVLFSDPANLTTVHEFHNGPSTIAFLKNINVAGGADCPEFALKGLQKALQKCSPNSEVWLATDAAAKDPEELQSVISLSQEKNVKIKFILTGTCPSRKKRQIGSGMDLFKTLASSTGGTVYVTNKHDIEQVAGVIKESVATSVVTLLKAAMDVGKTSTFKFPVDDTVEQITIKIVAEGGSTPNENITTPEGAVTSGYTTENLGGGIKLLKIENSTKGEWSLTRLDTHKWDVEVTARSQFDVSTKFVKKNPQTGFSYEIHGRPIAGENITLIVTAIPLDKIDTLREVVLIGEDGSEVARHGGLTHIPDSDLFRVAFVLPDQAFKVAVVGSDKSGNSLMRLMTTSILPVSIDLQILPMEGTVYINETVEIGFTVTNKGAAVTKVVVSVKDDQNFAQPPLKLDFDLQPGGNQTGAFTIKGGASDNVTTTVTVTASSPSSTVDNFQYGVKRISTSKRTERQKVDYSLPVCKVIPLSALCDLKMVDPCTCKSHTWKATAEIWDEGSGLFQITSTVGEEGSFNHDPFTPGQTAANGTVEANITGNCCNPHAHIMVVDLANNNGTCIVDLAPGIESQASNCTLLSQSETGNQVDYSLPVCNVTSLSALCDLKMVEPCTCKSHTWMATAEIWDEGSGLFQITSTVGEEGSFNHDPFTPGQTAANATVEANITGNCCNPHAHIMVVDLANNNGTCIVDLAPGIESQASNCTLLSQSETGNQVDYSLPVCNVTSLSTLCDLKMVEPCTCKSHTWTATAEIWDEGSGLFQITSTVGEEGSFNHDPFTPGQTAANGTVEANITGTCCHPHAHIMVVDLANNNSTCIVDLAPGVESHVSDCTLSQSETGNQDNGNLKVWIIAASTVGGLVVVALISTVVLYKLRIPGKA